MRRLPVTLGLKEGMIKYGLIYLSAATLGVIFGWLPYSIAGAVREYELTLLFKVSREGPGGFDDAVNDRIADNPERYSEPLIKILEKSKPGTTQEDLALSFIDFVKKENGVRKALCKFGRRHPDPSTQQLVMLILSDTPSTKLVSVSDYGDYKVETNLVIPIDQIENRCKNFSCCEPDE